jgi:two-component system LytT family sensor kinase
MIHAVVTAPLKLLAFVSWRNAIVVTLVAEPIGFLLTCLMRVAYAHVGLRVERMRRLVSIVLLCSLAAGAVDYAVSEPLTRVMAIQSSSLITLGQTWLRVVQYITWSFLYFWIKGAIVARERAVQLVSAEAAAREAEVRMLRAQLDPHFLFNALNTVLAGIRPDHEQLTPVVQGLSDYLRYSLVHRHKVMVPLGDEFDAALSYLVVEKARFRDGLVVHTHIDDAARRVSAPGVILQPLIENAVKHGYRSSPVPLRLTIDIRSTPAGGAAIEVTNSGRWVEPARGRNADTVSGYGVESVKRRLALVYPDAHRFDLTTTGEQVSVRIVLPAASSLLETA